MVEAAEPKAAPAPKAGMNKKMVFIIAGAVVLLLAIGGGAWFFMHHGNADESVAAEHGKHGKKGKASKAPAKKVKKEPALYVQLDPPFVVNFKAPSAKNFMQVTVQVMTRDSGIQNLVKNNDPIVRNDLLKLFSGLTYDEVASNEGQEALRARALEAVQAVVDSEGGDAKLVESVLFTSFVMQ